MGDDNNKTADKSPLVTCPHCGNEFELSETFREHFKSEMRKDFNKALRHSEAKIRAEVEQANQAQQAKSAKHINELEEQLKENQEAQGKREAQIRAEAEQASQEKLDERNKQLQDLQAQMKADQEAQAHRETEIRRKAEQKAADEYDIKRGEWDIEKKRLETQMSDMQRQLGQKSVELQGEALEEYLKHMLQTEFPFDTIEDIGRGQRGADLTQTVSDSRLGVCGMLVWEAKRTKHWNDNWIEKIKQDADRVGAHLRVIVTQAMPKDVNNFGQKDGVWVSNIECAVPLATALRLQLIETANLQRAMQGQGLKTEAIYHYLTSPRFSERIQRMVETWQALEKQVASEERAMRRQWTERRKQLARMQETTIEMFTDFTAILGQEIPQVPGLQLEALPSGRAAVETDN